MLLFVFFLSACTQNEIQDTTTTSDIITEASEATTTLDINNESLYYEPSVYIPNQENQLVRLDYSEYVGLDISGINCVIIIPAVKLTTHHNEEIKKCIFEYINSFGIDLYNLKETDLINIDYNMKSAKASEIEFDIIGQYKTIDMENLIEISQTFVFINNGTDYVKQ